MHNIANPSKITFKKSESKLGKESKTNMAILREYNNHLLTTAYTKEKHCLIIIFHGIPGSMRINLHEPQ
jgi:hypothetical protein